MMGAMHQSRDVRLESRVAARLIAVIFCSFIKVEIIHRGIKWKWSTTEECMIALTPLIGGVLSL